MKKAIASILILMTVTACSSGTAQTAAQTSAGTTAQTTSAQTSAVATTASTSAAQSSQGAMELSGQKEVGEGVFYISNESGTTKEGKPITILGGEKIGILMLWADYEEFDGSKYTYFFVDGKENMKNQWGSMGSTSFGLTGDALKNGIHTIEAIQWSGENMTGEVTMYKTAQYETSY